MTDYYASLAFHPDPSRRVGWESRLAQLSRFAAVASTLSARDTVLDVGAGLGDLTRFLARTHPEVRCHGLEARRAFVEEAARMAPPVALIHGRLGDGALALPEVDVAVAIGALVDGEPLAADGARLGRARALLGALLACARRHVVAIFACQDSLLADPLRSADGALGGLREAEVAWILPDGASAHVSRGPLPTDLVVVATRAGAPPRLPPHAQLREMARSHPMAPTCLVEALRFALLAGETARASALIAAGRDEPGLARDAAWRLLVARHDLLTGARG